LFENAAAAQEIPLQRSAQIGVLTDLSYVQLVGEGAAVIDIGYPMRYSHSAIECCDIADMVGLTRLSIAALAAITPDFKLTRGE
jgi:putative aminopeptidase FrvX